MRSLLLALALTATPALAQANPQIDYPAFQALAASVAPERAQRLIAFDAFKAEAAKPAALLLDDRSKDAFQRGHIKGAVHLPLPDFTAASLAEVIGRAPNRSEESTSELKSLMRLSYAVFGLHKTKSQH